ncbi:hypothetical protein VDGE_30437 [Verticillium dahliae]|uniref:Uncharacterized protein n=1 Tax=Verticillium dahliae TaxID=27337 RepID=A0A444RX63_VERDA|nr:hypothetical protein VDGE_30437 [Verticillium dahliae]
MGHLILRAGQQRPTTSRLDHGRHDNLASRTTGHPPFAHTSSPPTPTHLCFRIGRAPAARIGIPMRLKAHTAS